MSEILQKDGTEKRGGETKVFKKGGKMGQGVGALKRRDWIPLQTMLVTA